jgi:hypothetical protein
MEYGIYQTGERTGYEGKWEIVTYLVMKNCKFNSLFTYKIAWTSCILSGMTFKLFLCNDVSKHHL